MDGQIAEPIREHEKGETHGNQAPDSEGLAQDHKKNPQPGGEDAHVVGQLMPQGPNRSSNDIAQEEGEDGLCHVERPGPSNAPAAAYPDANSATRLKTTMDRASMGMNALVIPWARDFLSQRKKPMSEIKRIMT